MESERIRLKTFSSWPSWANQEPEILAKDGFYYTGEIDRVKCAFCLGVLKCWQPSDDPVLEHRSHFPRCPFVCGDDVGNIPIASHTSYNSFPYRETEQLDMTAEENRLTTFSRWPHHLFLDPKLLARAGFYHYPDDHKPDKVKCAYCRGRLYDWQPDDDPWVEHARCFPKCKYIQLCMGQDFIDDVQNQKRVHLQRSSEGRETPQSEVLSRMRSHPSASRPVDEHGECVGVEAVLSRMPSLQSTLDEQMKSVQVEAVLEMGYPEHIVRQVVEARLKSEGRAFSNAEELASLVVAKETADKHADDKHMRVSEENDRLREEYLCKICMENQIRVTFMPCGHLVCCSECASVMEECPICRRSISDSIRTFY